MKHILTILLFFPSITFSVITAEIAPYSLLYSLMHRVWTKKIIFLSILLVTLSLYVSIFRYSHIPNDLIRSVLAYANVFIIFNIIIKFSPEKLNKLNKTAINIFFALSIIGLFQYSGLLSQLRLESIFQILIPRGHLTDIGGSRGVTLLSSEPSRAGIELVFIYAILRYNLSKIGTKIILLDIAMLVYITLIIKSVTALVFLCLLLLFCNIAFYIAFYFCSIFGLGYLAIVTDVRAMEVLLRLLDSNGIGEIFNILINTSGFRFISVYAAYLAATYEIFGYGIGNWEFSSVEAMNNTGFKATDFTFFSYRGIEEFISLRPTSFAASVSLDFGMLGLLSFVYWTYLIVLRRLNKRTIPVIAIFLLHTFGVGAIGNPVPWICTAIVLGSECSKEWT